MPFEVYKPRGERQDKKPVISLSKTSIVFNSVAREKIQSNRIELAFDRENGIIRVKAVDDGGMEMKKTKIFGKGFFNQFGINQKGKFEASYEPAERALYVSIK